MRVLVTGGLGYVGSVVALRLAQAGHEVALLTRGGRPTPRPPARRPDRGARRHRGAAGA